MRWALMLLLVSGCDRVFGIDHLPEPPPADAPFHCDSPLTAGDYSQVASLFPSGYAPTLSEDQTLMYFGMNSGLYSSRFGGAAWTTPVPEPILDDPTQNEDRPSLTYDATHMYFTRRPTSSGNGGVHVPFETARARPDDNWSAPTQVPYPSVVGGSDVMFGVPTRDGQRVVVTHGVSSRYRIDELVRMGGQWTLLATTAGFYADLLDQDMSDSNTQLSPDGCWVLFVRIRPTLPHVLMFANRNASGVFDPPQLLLTNAPGADLQHPWLAPDGTKLYDVNGTTIEARTRN